MPKTSQHVQSVIRALRILLAFADGQPGMSVSDLSQQLDLPKSTVSRLLQTLEQMHFVARDERTGLYRLGSAIFALAAQGLTPEHIRVVAQPHLQALAAKFAETVNLSLRDGHAVVNTEQIIGSRRLVARIGWIGRRMSLHAVSSGKAILAFLPAHEIEVYLSTPLKAFTSQTITDPIRLQRELEHIRRRGYAIAMSELEEGLHAISAPIFDYERVIGAVGISGPASRMPESVLHEMASDIVAAATHISHQLGYRDAA